MANRHYSGSYRPPDGYSDLASPGMEALIEAAVERAVARVLNPYLHRLASCEPAVYTVAQAAQVLQVSDDTVGRLVRRGVLLRVPHLEGKVLIPRSSVDRLTRGQPAATSDDATESSSRSMRSAAS
jgi:excisionase family DNA binding protein